MENDHNSRRDFIKWLGATSGLLTLHSVNGFATQTATKYLAKANNHHFLTKFGPIDPQISLADDNQYLGDRPQLKAHPILLNKAEFLKKNLLPTPAEEVPLVIVGGGVSGLISAYLLRKYKPIVLEQAPRFGGNAKGEVWNGVPYSVGAAYYMEQVPETEIYKLFSEVGAHKVCRIKNDEDPVLLKEKFYNKFWSGETDPQHQEQFKKLSHFFKDVFNETNQQKFPEMPLPIANFKDVLADTKKGIEYLMDLDNYNFKNFLEKKVLHGQSLHPHIETLLEHYCWSTFATGLQEVSAIAGLNAYASEFGKVYVAPAGNAAVAECFLKKILETVPAENLRANCLVVDAVVNDQHTVVTYSDEKGELRSIKAQVAIMACPKFIVKHLLRDIEPERLAAIEKLKYHAYLVGNALIEKPIQKSFYDAYLLNGGIDAEKSQITDAILANYASGKMHQSSVLTLYRGFPYDTGRTKMFAEESFKMFKDEMEKQLQEEILPALKIKKEEIKSLRITRWGHPMPVPSPGLLQDGTIEKIRLPFKERIFFIEQDNWMLAAIETAAEEALFWTKKIKTILN